jgi:hypothetical protein
VNEIQEIIFGIEDIAKNEKLLIFLNKMIPK